jgi:fructose-1,6-bisphosphatase II
MVRSDDCLFAATGITESPMLQGVKRQQDQWLTHSMLALGRKRQMYFLKNLRAQPAEENSSPVQPEPALCV